jgi:TatD DNase family protein
VNLTDTHCHLDFNDFEKDRAAVLARAWEAGLEHILIPGIDLASSRVALALAESHPRLFAAIGVHPSSAATWDGRTLESLEALAAHPKVVAIGEIGLDYYRDRAPRPLQRQVFEAQLDLARRLHLPVVVHTRNASEASRGCTADSLQMLAEAAVMGVLHSFSGNQAEAEAALALGLALGFTGPITFKTAEALRQVAASVPLDRLLIETDSPFLTPHPRRGQRNEPAFVRYVAEKLAEIHNQPPPVVAEQTTVNARRLFHWSN